MDPSFRLAGPAFALLAAALLAQSPGTENKAQVRGVVRNAKGHPVAAKVTLRLQAAEQALSAHADAEGRYQFPALSPGTYSVRAEMGPKDAAMSGPFVLGPGEAKQVDLTLGSGAMAEFFDEPNFVVAGVTDSSNLGVHGSNVVPRSAEALVKATATLAKREENNEAHHRMADAAEQEGRALEAAREYQRAAELDPSEPNLFDWGAELLKHRAFEPATEVFAKGHGLFPRSARMLLGLGAAWYARGVYESAARSLFEAADLNPADPTPYLFLGKVQSTEITLLPDYLERMRRFASAEPNNAWASYYYAVALWKQREDSDKETARQVQSWLEKAVRLDQSLGAAWLQLGNLHSAQSDLVRAKSDYQKAIEATPQLEEAHYRLGLLYRRAGEDAKAQNELRIAEQLSKQSAADAEKERGSIQQLVWTLREPRTH
jgi:tetratricopeptide (TPR) repeat protein